jgi:Protein of unknown function (DUF3442).
MGLTAAAVLVLAGGAARAEAPKWGPHIDLEGKAGTDRHLGEADLFLPVLQDADTLLFANVRTRLDDEGGREGNFGLGLRHMLDSGWNLGTYGSFDRRRSDLDNYFNQVTVGAEALGPDWDLRANAYLPVGTKRYQEDSLNTAEFSGASVIFRGGEERSLKGFDAEIGWRVPVFEVESGANLRVYGGGYHFSADDVPDVAGPRGRLDLTFDQVPHLWDGSRLSLGAEWQHDDPRGSQGFLSARLRIPLQVFGQPASKLNAQERRMADPVVRDVDIVSRAGTFGAPETATAANGGALAVVDSGTTNGQPAIQAALNAAGANSTVVLSGDFITSAGTVTVNAGQTLMGGGSLEVRSPSGRTATLTVPGATLTGNVGGSNYTVALLSDSTLMGLTINNTATGANARAVRVNGVTGVRILNNTINALQNGVGAAQGITVEGGASNITISGNTVTATHTGTGNALAIQVNNASAAVTGNTMTVTGGTFPNFYGLFLTSATATVSGNTLNVSGDGGGIIRAFEVDGGTINPGSTGNVVLAGGCSSNIVPTIGYTDANGVSQTCPP